jgi:hypothetical protein
MQNKLPNVSQNLLQISGMCLDAGGQFSGATVLPVDKVLVLIIFSEC